MFELEKDERIRGIDTATAALSMALAHDHILETLLTLEMLAGDTDDAEWLARTLLDRWQRRYGDNPSSDFIRVEDGERVHRATRAFVDRLCRKALSRSAKARAKQEASEGTPSD